MIIKNITELIGNTPILKVDSSVHGLKNIDLYIKLELFNPFGSIKDRTAYGILKNNINDIKSKNKTIIELSSGNTSRALQGIASINGLKLKTVSSRIRVKEFYNILKLQGADIEDISHLINPEDAYSSLNIVDNIALNNKDKYFYSNQYRNENNPKIHNNTTAKEIINDLDSIDYFITSIGTAGSSLGIIQALKEKNNDMKTIGVISSKDDFIPGIRHKDEIFDVGTYDSKNYDVEIDIHSSEAIEGVLDLVRKMGVMAGPTSGATYKAAIKHLQSIDKKLKKKQKAVMIAFDQVEMYFSYLQERRPDIFE